MTNRIKNLELRIRLLNNIASLALFLILMALFSPQVSAVYDPLSVPNNKFGIHIISPTPDESSPAASLVNSSGGDWGYVTFVIESKDRDLNKWQNFFNDLRRRHLIPIIRIATLPDASGFWKVPDAADGRDWAEFLNKLNWPVKNRYVVIYNEPNHGVEWGNAVNAKEYAQILDETTKLLKEKSADFFVMNAGFDASAPQNLPAYQDELDFLKQMDLAVPGIFSELDGWVSHSYPNPAFSGSPLSLGRGTVRTYAWELQNLKTLGLKKELPVFITETGWKHAEGLNYDPTLLPALQVADNLKSAFDSAWSNNSIVAVTPFLLDYKQAPFDHFSFREPFGKDQYYPIFDTVKNLPKAKGIPIQANQAQLIKGEVFNTLVAGQSYDIYLTFKNIGQSIWNDGGQTKLVISGDTIPLNISSPAIPDYLKVEPGDEYTFKLNLRAPQSGTFKLALNLYQGSKQFDSPPLYYITEVKSPVILKIKASLEWKKSAAGQYLLGIMGVAGNTLSQVILNSGGKSGELEERFLLPDYSFDFSLQKPFYQSKTLHQSVHSGINELDFGTLRPDFRSALLHPQQLWFLLPFSDHSPGH